MYEESSSDDCPSCAGESDNEPKETPKAISREAKDILKEIEDILKCDIIEAE